MQVRKAPKCSDMSTALKPTTGMEAGVGWRGVGLGVGFTTRTSHRCQHLLHNWRVAAPPVPAGRHAHPCPSPRPGPHPTPAQRTCQQRAREHQRRERQVKPPGHAAACDTREAEDGQEVDDKRVAAPREHHIKVRREVKDGPAEGARVDGLGGGEGEGARRAPRRAPARKEEVCASTLLAGWHRCRIPPLRTTLSQPGTTPTQPVSPNPDGPTLTKV
jgi:hypothetical protein